MKKLLLKSWLHLIQSSEIQTELYSLIGACPVPPLCLECRFDDLYFCKGWLASFTISCTFSLWIEPFLHVFLLGQIHLTLVLSCPEFASTGFTVCTQCPLSRDTRIKSGRKKTKGERPSRDPSIRMHRRAIDVQSYKAVNRKD